MPDITKCKGTECPLKNQCYRFTIQSEDLGQSYFKDIPYSYENGECEYFWLDMRFQTDKKEKKNGQANDN